MKIPFNKQEQKVMNLIVKAHNEFLKLETTHPSEMPDWIQHLHGLQVVLSERVLRREYPDTFITT